MPGWRGSVARARTAFSTRAVNSREPSFGSSSIGLPMRTLTGPGSGTCWPFGMIWYAPRMCIGTTGVPVSRARWPTPGLNSWIRPSGERLPSGNRTRFQPALSSWLELCS